LIDKLTFIGVHLIRTKRAILFIWSGILLVITNSWGNNSGESEWNINILFVLAVTAFENCSSCSDGGLTGGGDDTWNHNDLTDQVALKITEHGWVLI